MTLTKPAKGEAVCTLNRMKQNNEQTNKQTNKQEKKPESKRMIIIVFTWTEIFKKIHMVVYVCF